MTAAGVLFPMEQVAREFRALVERPVPLEMKTADLGEGLPDEPVDVLALRALLLHPALGHQARGAVWARLLELAASGDREGEDWRLAAVGMALPGLTRVSMRWARTVKEATPEQRIWPQSTADPAISAGPDALVAATYANRASVPRDLWLHLLEHAERHVDVLVYSGTFLAQSNPHVAEMLATRARHGTQVRLCFADPTGQAVARHDQEEELDGTMAAKIRASLTYYRPLLGQDRCEVRLHDATVYASLFRYDDDLLANPHIWGQPASANPLLHLRRGPARGWFDHYAASFDAVWTAARPWDGTTARTSKE